MNNGRIFSHTALFLILLTTISLISKRKGVILLTLGSAVHHVLDKIFLDPSSFFYPFSSRTFPVLDWSLADWLWVITHDPYVIGGELLGLAFLVYFAWKGKLWKLDNIRSIAIRGVIQLV